MKLFIDDVLIGDVERVTAVDGLAVFTIADAAVTEADMIPKVLSSRPVDLRLDGESSVNGSGRIMRLDADVESGRVTVIGFRPALEGWQRNG